MLDFFFKSKLLCNLLSPNLISFPNFFLYCVNLIVIRQVFREADKHVCLLLCQYITIHMTHLLNFLEYKRKSNC